MLGFRLSFGLFTLLALLISIGVYAIWLFMGMGSAFSSVLEDKYRNVKALHDSQIAVSRINSTYLVETWPAPLQMNRSAFSDNAALLEKNLRVLKANALDPENREQVGRFETELRDYLAKYAMIFALRPEQRMEFGELRKQVGGTELLLTEMVGQLIQSNEAAIFAAQQDAQNINTRSFWLLVLAILLAVAISLATSYRLHRLIVVPIRTLTRYVQQIGEEGSDSVMPVKSKDELGRLATAFNEMAVRLKQAHQSVSNRISQLNATMTATMAMFPDPVYVVNHAGQMLLRNPAGKKLSQELGLGDGLPLEIYDKVLEVVRTDQDHTPADFKDAYCYRIQEQKKYFLPRLLILRNVDRSVHGVAIVLQDVTRLQLIDSLKTNLVATVSHELKTPLTSIRMALHILSEQKIGGLNKEQWHMVAAAQEDSERLLRILNNLLDISRMEDGLEDLHLEAVHPSTLADMAVRDVQRKASARRMSVHVEIEPDLPCVQVDRLRIAHVFRNFLINAIKFSPTGGAIALHVRRRVHDPEVIRFSVIDQGPGIPSLYQSRIFQKFFRVPDQDKAGAGLGLSIARQIAEAHHGRVGVFSKVGEGSEFFCDLPAAPLPAASPSSPVYAGSA